MTEFELRIMRRLHEVFGFLRPAAEIVTEFGDEILIFCLVAVIYFAVSKQKGEELGFIVLSSACVNGMLKSAVRRPRPFTRDASLATAELAERYAGTFSFPSGHSQNAGAVYFASLRAFASKWIKALCIVAMVLVPLSRVMLGVHYPSDVVAGLATGILCALGFGLLWRKAEGKRELFLYSLCIGLTVIVLCVCLPVSYFAEIDRDMIKSFGALSGFALGCAAERGAIGMQDTVIWKYRILRVLFALAVMAALQFGLKALFELFGSHFLSDYLRYVITIGGTLTFCPWVIKRFSF